MPDALSRRRLLATTLAAAPLADCGNSRPWHDIDVSGALPALDLTMRRAPGGAVFTQADVRGKVALLYFGYTYCPDVCPLTLQHLAMVLARMGPVSADVRVLFVTVDPNRDTLAELGRYVALFGPGIIGLRGTPDGLGRLARRYRVAYSVTPPGGGHGYEVTHSSAIYAFDRTGAARLLIPSMASSAPDIAGVAADLGRLVHERPSLLRRVEALV